MDELDLRNLQAVRNEDGSYKLMVQERTRDITPSGKVIYSGEGLFHVCTKNSLINASVNGPGIANWLNWKPTIYKYNQSGILVWAGKDPREDYTPPDTTCGWCETGNYGFCEFRWCLGEYCVSTLPRKVTDLGLRVCEAHPIYRIHGNITDAMGNVVYPSGSLIEDDDEWGLVVAANQIATIIGREMWAGTGVMVGVHREMLGLMSQINNGWADLLGTDCPGADPDVKDFDYNCIGDLYSGRSICEYVEYLVRNAVWRAVGAGLGTIAQGDMAIWSYPDIADHLVRAWECCMAQTCEPMAGTTNVNLNIDALDVLARRRAQGFINNIYQAGTINVQGMQIPVFGDLNIPHTVDGDHKIADVYLLVKRVGGMEVLYGEYQDFEQTMPARVTAGRPGVFRTSDGGRWAWAFNNETYCYAENLEIKPRVVVAAPFLQGRIQNVCAEVLQNLQPPMYGGKDTPPALTCEQVGPPMQQ